MRIRPTVLILPIIHTSVCLYMVNLCYSSLGSCSSYSLQTWHACREWKFVSGIETLAHCFYCFTFYLFFFFPFLHINIENLCQCFLRIYWNLILQTWCTNGQWLVVMWDWELNSLLLFSPKWFIFLSFKSCVTFSQYLCKLESSILVNMWRMSCCVNRFRLTAYC